ncbi:NADPH-dependent FMN reductase [Dyella flava]|uniref:NADPH-dependent FMN reductase n=1 Tax=Dyella flava TaxID=1920170 RepID=UPI0024E1620E|nr:NADPH-dependent FMN reductase [Dyella flava]
MIMGSTRAGRICPKITAWIAQLGHASTGLTYETVDLADWPLPMNDEPEIPEKGLPYAQAHTRAWSEKIKTADAVIFVTPQFNWGYPAALKNAIDHLYHEWRNKPAAIVTYGGHGGGKCAEQLKQIASAVKMRVMPTMPGIILPKAVIREAAPFEPEHDFQQHLPSIQNALAELAEHINVTSES